MQRIICDIYSKDKLRLWEFDANSPSTRDFNRKITAVNNMYAWLYEKGILENVSFEFKDYSDQTYFAFDTKDLAVYRKEMEISDVKDAALAVQHIFDEEYTPCNFCGAIELTWTMQTYRDVDGCVGRSWENSLVQGLNNKAICDLPYIVAEKGVKEAVKVLFERCEFVPTDLVVEEVLNLPHCVTISAATLALGTDDIYKVPEELSNIIGDYLSNEYGYCHAGFAFDVIYNEMNEPSSVIVTDIEWDTDGAVIEEDSLDEKINAAEDSKTKISVAAPNFSNKER